MSQFIVKSNDRKNIVINADMTFASSNFLSNEKLFFDVRVLSNTNYECN